MNTSLERLVVEQLLAGSQNGGGSVMPKNTKVLNVSLTDNTCYVNLDSSFISGISMWRSIFRFTRSLIR